RFAAVGPPLGQSCLQALNPGREFLNLSPQHRPLRPLRAQRSIVRLQAGILGFQLGDAFLCCEHVPMLLLQRKPVWTDPRPRGYMSKVRCQISISLDGFVAGPNQTEENPLGEGSERLHDWVLQLAAWRQAHGAQGGEVNESTGIFEESLENVGAGVMGRNMFGPIGGGPWGDEQWTGW